MSILKNQKNLERTRKKHSSVNQLFYLNFSKKSSVSSVKRLNIWASGENKEKANERVYLEEKGIIKRKLEAQQKWKRYSKTKSIQLYTHHLSLTNEGQILLKSTHLMRRLEVAGIKHKQIRKGCYALESMLEKRFKGCSDWKKQLGIFIFYHPKIFYSLDPIQTIINAWAKEGDDLEKLRWHIVDAIRRLKIIFEIKDHCIVKHSGLGLSKKIKGKWSEKKATYLHSFFLTQTDDCINKDIVILKNNITNFKKNNYKDQKTAYFRYHIWKIIRSYDAHWKEKRYKKNILLYYGRDLLVNPDYFEFAGMYKQMLARIQNENVSYSELKKTIETFKFLAERYVVWFLDNKKEDREKHMMIYRLTKNPIVFNKK